MAMLLAMIGVSLAGLLLPMMVTQIGSTREEVRRSLELNAAEAGLDIGLGHIRSADDGTGTGTGALAELPCGLLAGAVGIGAGRYEVTVDYFPVDPQGHAEDLSWISLNRISCLAGGGPLSAPAYALLRSQGTATAAGAFSTVPNRTVHGTYTFQTTNQNIAGGLVHVYQTATSDDLCMDAGSGSPAAGTSLQMQPCTPGDSQQTFAYDTHLNLLLVSAKTPLLPLGMCLDAGTPHAAGQVVAFQPCATTTKPQQQWSINDSANFEGTTDGKTLDGYCFHVQTPNTPGSFVVLSTSCHGAYDNIQTFQPEPPVGAGAAGPDANQLVNFSEFGRCLDVTEQNVNYAYLIAWPCKQAPDPANITWNQKWALPVIAAKATEATGPITTKPAAGLYCLQSPLSIAAGRYVKTVLCPVAGATPANMLWTVHAGTTSYATSYRIEDDSGYCLTYTDPNAIPADLYPNVKLISKIVVATCSGSTAQKWNAPPNILQSLPLKDVGES
jgi:hypothetical protein